MPNANYRRGADCERRLVKALRAGGYVAYRTPGSKGATDVIAMRSGFVDLYQVKTGGKSMFSDFGPESRRRLREEAIRAGATAYLAWFPPGGKVELCASEKWPS